MLIKRGFGLPQQLQPLSHLPLTRHFTSIFNSLHSLHYSGYPSPTNHHFLPYFTTIYPYIINRLVNSLATYLLYSLSLYLKAYNSITLIRITKMKLDVYDYLTAGLYSLIIIYCVTTIVRIF